MKFALKATSLSHKRALITVLAIFLSLIIIITTILLALYFFAFRTFTIISDPAFSYVLKQVDIPKIRLSLATKGIRLKIVDLPASAFSDSNSSIEAISESTLHSEPITNYQYPAFINAIKSYAKSRYILLSPLSAAYAASNKINLSSILNNTIVAALYTPQTATTSQATPQANTQTTLQGTSTPQTATTSQATSQGASTFQTTSASQNIFDCTLVSDLESGWIQAAKEVAAEMKTISQNTALVLDLSSSHLESAIKDQFQNGYLSVFLDDGNQRAFTSLTLGEMVRQGIIVALCPYTQTLSDFFKTPNTISWVIDYRFTDAIPPKQLYGIVLPDLLPALKIITRTTKNSCQQIPLEYHYEKI